MRRSVWLLPLLALSIWGVSVGYPIIASAGLLARLERSDVAARHLGDLLAVSAAWALAVTLGAMLLGWAPDTERPDTTRDARRETPGLWSHGSTPSE